jgi:putative chitobiose transport system permease protein
MNFFGKNVIFYAILSTMIIPFHTIMITLFIVCLKLGLDDSYAGAILPFTVNAFGIFLMRQAFRGVPGELVDAALIDGCSQWGVFVRIMLPLVKPALGALALFTFVARWNSFLWPVIILKSEAKWTLQQGIASLSGFFGTDWARMTSAMVLSMIPILLLFLFLQRFFLEQYAGALKG